MSLEFNTQKALEYSKWASSTENVDKYDSNDEVEDFPIINFEASTYSSDLNEFSQAHISLFDKDDDGVLNQDELVDMLSYTEEDPGLLTLASNLYGVYRSVYNDNVIPQFDDNKDGALNEAEFISAMGLDMNKLSEEEKASWHDLFETFNMLNYDGDKENLNADELLIALNEEAPDLDGVKMYELRAQASKYEVNQLINERKDTILANMDINGDGQVDSKEYAAHLFTEDLDLSVYNMQTGDGLLEALDGKINYGNNRLYPLMSQGQAYENKEYMKNWFYNTFYAE